MNRLSSIYQFIEMVIPFYHSEPSTTSNQQPKKRRRKESAKPCVDVVDVSRKQAKIAKTAGGKVAPLLANNFLNLF